MSGALEKAVRQQMNQNFADVLKKSAACYMQKPDVSDDKCNRVLLFLLTGITLEERADCLAVAALKLQTELDSNIFPGVHYCKVLSPARALDWIMTDSLKKQKKQDAVALII
jgi:hypothetical protein